MKQKNTNFNHPWRDDNCDLKRAIKRDEKKWERILEKLDEQDMEKIREWRGQESADEQYEGIVDN